MHRGDGTHRGLGGVIIRAHREGSWRCDCVHRGDDTHRGLGGVIVCTGVMVRIGV